MHRDIKPENILI